MQSADFNFHLPPELIAQQPVAQRDHSNLLVLDRGTGQIAHRRFRDLPEYLRPSDVLVLNDSRVISARLRARNRDTGGAFEILLSRENGLNDWWALMRPGKRARVGARLDVLDAKRLTKQRVREQVDLAYRKIVRRAKVRVHGLKRDLHVCLRS